MALSLNKVVIAGRLGRDPEIRQAGSARVANMRVAVSERYKDKTSGEYKERTEWVPVTVWQESAINFIENYVKKGSSVYVEGRFETRSYKSNNDEKETYTTEVVVRPYNGTVQLNEPMTKRDSGGDAPAFTGNKGGGRPAPAGKGNYQLDDDIPF